jgi:hypothetical protein
MATDQLQNAYNKMRPQPFQADALETPRPQRHRYGWFDSRQDMRPPFTSPTRFSAYDPNVDASWEDKFRTQVFRTGSDVTGRGIAAGIRAAKDRYDSSIWGTIMNTVNQWGVNVSKWLNARQFEQDNVLTKIGLGSWGRLGTAAAAAGALAAAYYAWKKWNKKREGENTPMVPANASFMPEFSDYIANEAERFDVAMCTAMTLLTEAVADGVADGQITARVNQMIASIKRDADKAARVLARIAQDQDASKAPPELMEQMAAVASMLEERNAA